jgi:hypothetical protein
MTTPRVFWPLVFVAALLAACSGNLGGGQSTLPGAPQSGTNTIQQVTQPIATPTPVAASNVATLGNTVAPQVLPTVQGYGGSIAFPKPSATPSPASSQKSSGPSDDSAPLSIGITSSTVEPSDAPHFSPTSGKRHARHDPNALTPLLFISLMSTSDVTLNEYPKIAVDVPREVATKHRDDTYALALYDPEAKSKSYQLAIAERDYSSPAPGSTPTPVPTPVPTPSPTATPFGMFNGPTTFTPPPIGAGLGSSGLPPQHVAFRATAATLTMRANRPVVFALYAIPPQPSPSPSPSPKASGSPLPGASGSPAPAASPSPLPSSSASPPTAGPTSKPVSI